jgi:phosphinothricin acetyltransferase
MCTARVAITTEFGAGGGRVTAALARVRDWRPGDAAACAAIYALWVAETTVSFEFEPPDADEIARRFDALLAQGYPVLVAEHDDAILGYAYASAFRARPAYRGTVENSVYVDRARHGAGIGRALMQALIARCAEAGFRRMVAVIADSANAGSIGFHRALGFEDGGVLPGVGLKFGRELDIVLMWRALAVDGDS